MKAFCYTIKNAVGIHARPAGMLARMAEKSDSSIAIEKGGRSVNLKNLIAVMQLNVMYNETITITVEGSDEEEAFECIKAFFEENL